MKRVFAYYLLLVTGILTAETESISEKKLTIATTHGLAQEWVKQIAGETLTVRLITPGAPPEEASLIIETGLETKQIHTTPGITQIVLSDGLQLLKIGQPLRPKSCKNQNREGKGKSCCCNTSNPSARYEPAFAPELLNAPVHPYAWMDVSLAMSMVISLTETLSGLTPEHATFYKQRCKTYLKKLKQLDLQLFQSADALSQSSRKEPNPSWRYFSRRYGLESSDSEEKSLPLLPPMKSTYIETMQAYAASLKNKEPGA